MERNPAEDTLDRDVFIQASDRLDMLIGKEKYIKPTRVFELEDGVGIYRNRRR